MTKPKPKELHKKPGPKPPAMDLVLIERLAQRQGSIREIAACLGLEESLFRKRAKKDPELSAALKRGWKTGKMTLRTRQYNLAMEGNVTMLIWLGKQYLEQKDKAATEISGKDGKPLVESWLEMVKRAAEPK